MLVGTRVIILTGGAGEISEVRTEPHLRTYVITRDDGARIFASPYDLAREDDASRSPLAARPEY